MLQLDVIGNLGADAEIKNFNGKNYVSFNVAHSEKRNGQETTVWVSCLWYGDGGAMMQYLKRGTKVFARGRLNAKIFTGKNNIPQIALNLNVSEITLCGARSEQTQNTAPQATPTPQQAPAPSPADGWNNPEKDDDLPF